MEAESNSLVCSSEVKNADIIKLVDEAVMSIFTRLNSKMLGVGVGTKYAAALN